MSRLIQGNDVAQTAQQFQQMQAQANAVLMAEIRATASRVFAASIAPYLQALIMDPNLAELGGKPDPAILKTMAILAAKCAPYLPQAQGMAQVDEKKHWKDLEVTPAKPG